MASTFTAGTAFLRVVPSLQGFQTSIRSQLAGMNIRHVIRVEADTSEAQREIGRFATRVAALRNQTVNVDVNKKQFIDAANAVMMFGKGLASLAMPAAMVGAAPAILAIAGAATTAVGAIGLVPGAMVAAGLAVGTLKMGVAGLGDAFKNMGDPKKFAEALASLSPEAQKFALSVKGVSDEFKGLQLDVQNTLLRGFGTVVTQLSNQYLPTLRTGFVGIAAEMRNFGMEIVAVAKNAGTLRDTKTIFENTRLSMAALVPAGGAIMEIFRDVATVGSTFLPGLAGGFTAAAERAAQFVDAARESGQLATWIRTGMDALSTFGQIAGNVFGILRGVLNAASVAGTGFLGGLQLITSELNAMVNSAQGQYLLVEVFHTINMAVVTVLTALHSLLPVFGAFLSSIGQIASAVRDGLQPIISALVPLLAQIGSLTAQVVVPVISTLAGVMLEVARALTSALMPVLPQLVGAFQQILIAVTPLIFQLQAFAPIFGVLAQVAADVINAFAPLITLFANTLVGALAIVAPAVGEVARIFGDTLVGALRTLYPPLEVLSGAFLSLVRAVSPILPVLAQFAAMIINALMPVLPPLILALASVMDTITFLMPAVMSLVSGALEPFRTVLGYLTPVLTGIATVIKDLAPVITVIAVAWGAYTAAVAAYTAVMRIAQIVTVTFQVVMGILNATLFANPIGLVVLAITAFVAAIIIAWNESETFRRIVTDAWNGIKTAAETAWNGIKVAVDAVWNFLRGVFDGIVTAVNAIGEAMSWLWTNVIEPVFNFIGLAARVLFAVVVTAVFTPIVIFIENVLIPAFNFFRDAATAAWQIIQDAISTVWNWLRDNVFQPVVDFFDGPLTDAGNELKESFTKAWNDIQTAISTVWNWLRDNVLQPNVDFYNGPLTDAGNELKTSASTAWTDIQNAVGTVWNWLRDNVFQPIVNWINETLVPKMNWLRDQAVAAWNSIRDSIASVWNFLRDNVWNPLVNFVTVTIPDAFARGRDAVGRAWDSIKRIVRDPIQAVIDIVYNKGIVKVWNFVAGLVGLGPLAEYHMPAFAQGGMVHEGLIRGPGSGTSDSIPALAVDGTKRAPIRVSAREYIMPERVTRQHLPFLEALRAGQPEAIQAAGGRKAHPYGRPMGFAAGGLVEAAITKARQMNGTPYIWGGVGPNGADCSGFMSILTNVLRGRSNPHSRVGTTATFPWPGFKAGTGSAFAIGNTKNAGNGIGHMAGTLAGNAVESGSGHGPMIGGRALSATSSMFNYRGFLPEVGGAFVDAGPGGGPAFDPIAWLLSGAGVDLRSIADTLTRFGATPWGQGAIGIAKKMASAVWDWAVGKAMEIGGNISDNIGDMFGSAGGSTRNIVQNVAGTRGWGPPGQDWAALDWIIQHESGWNPTAQNPTSTASGLFQFINGTWKAYGGSTASAKQASVEEQARVGMRYIGERYTNPRGAKAFWERNRWYDDGGLLDGRGVFFKNTLEPERVLSGRQNRAFEHMVDTIDRVYTGHRGSARDDAAFAAAARGASPAGAGGAPLVGTLNAMVPEGAGVNDLMDAALFKLRHAQKGGARQR